MQDYHSGFRYLVNDVVFDHKFGRHHGRGVLVWNPPYDLTLEAFLDRSPFPASGVVEIGKFGVIQEEDFHRITMKVGPSERAIIPPIPITDEIDLFNAHLFKSLAAVYFSVRSKPKAQDSSESWVGSALFLTDDLPVLTDAVRSETAINGRPIKGSVGNSGLWFDNSDEEQVVAIVKDKRYVELRWALDRSRWSQALAWRWPEALALALGILSGQSVQMLQREMTTSKGERSELRKQVDPVSLRFLAPFFGNKHQLNRSHLITLTKFFLNRGVEQRICRNIFYQLVDASKQNNIQVSSLLVSTILEAIARNLENRPFRPGGRHIDTKQFLGRFRERYLTPEWKADCERLDFALTRLRDRNAHPDWLLGTNGELSDADVTEIVDHMIFVSHFYGYMILGLAGIKDIKPLFPSPHREWRASVSIERTVESEERSPN